MKGIAVLLGVTVLFYMKKKVMLWFYFQLAFGRTTYLLRIMQQILTGNNRMDIGTEQQIEWLHRQKLSRTEIISRDGLTLTGYYG